MNRGTRAGVLALVLLGLGALAPGTAPASATDYAVTGNPYEADHTIPATEVSNAYEFTALPLQRVRYSMNVTSPGGCAELYFVKGHNVGPGSVYFVDYSQESCAENYSNTFQVGLVDGTEFTILIVNPNFVDVDYRIRIGILRSPVAAFTSTPAAAVAGSPVQFNASGSMDPDGDDLTYVWSFGDGETALGPVVNHTYVRSGTYTVTLRVSDGTYETTTTRSIGVDPAPGTLSPAVAWLIGLGIVGALGIGVGYAARRLLRRRRAPTAPPIAPPPSGPPIGAPAFPPAAPPPPPTQGPPPPYPPPPPPPP